jgi:hypothetical protein
VACSAAGLESGECFRQSFRVKHALGNRVPKKQTARSADPQPAEDRML